MKRITSLRSRILSRLLPALLAVLTLSGAVSYFGASFYVNQVFDRGLVDSLNGLASRVMLRDGRVVFDFPEAAQKIFEWDLEDAAYYRVYSRSLGHLAGHTDLEMGVPAARKSDVLKTFDAWDGNYRGRRIRGVSKTLSLPGMNDEIHVVVAETTLARDRFSREVLLTVLIPELVLILLATLIIWRTLNRAISPVSEAARSLERRTQHSEEPLDDSRIPDEIRPLTSALNSLLNRLQQALQIQRRFVADAAHQLRTPLTALRLHTDNALIQTRMEDARPMLEQVKVAADRSIRLSQQLLALAQSEEIILSGHQEVFDMDALVSDIIALWKPRAERAGIGLTYLGAASGQPIFVMSNPDLMTQVFDNLIDNALRYCPPGSQVVVACEERAGGATEGGDENLLDRLIMHVTDNGPGIRPEARAFMLRRFVRGDQTPSAPGQGAQGSGLGLAIASEIMTRLHGQLNLGDPPGHSGLRVTLEIPGLIRASAG